MLRSLSTVLIYLFSKEDVRFKVVTQLLFHAAFNAVKQAAEYMAFFVNAAVAYNKGRFLEIGGWQLGIFCMAEKRGSLKWTGILNCGKMADEPDCKKMHRCAKNHASI